MWWGSSRIPFPTPQLSQYVPLNEITPCCLPLWIISPERALFGPGTANDPSVFSDFACILCIRRVGDKSPRQRLCADAFPYSSRRSSGAGVELSSQTPRRLHPSHHPPPLCPPRPLRPRCPVPPYHARPVHPRRWMTTLPSLA